VIGASGARAIGVKTLTAVALGILLLAVGGRRALDPTYLRHLSPGACFLIGLVASLAVGLAGVGWRFHARSRYGVALRRGRPAVVETAQPRELPGIAQRVLLLVGFGSVLVGALGNHAAARIAQLPDELTAPSPSAYCMPEPAAAAAAAPPPPPPAAAEPPGCALVKRAFQLGYAKTLGECAPRRAAPAAVSPITRREVCTRRQLDEPFLHYGYRRVARAAGAATSVDPVVAAEHRVGEVRTHIEFLDGLLADIHHAITGSPHASHHLWVNLPDPHPAELRDRILGEVRCSQRYADLPLWPAWKPGEEAPLVEHVLGQLLFATRFGSTASCSDYVIHWGAAPETCTRLATEPVAVLDRDGALPAVRAVLDRRTRQLELAALAGALGRPPPVSPPAATAIVSLSCFVVEPSAPSGSAAATGKTVAIDGNAIGLREIHVPRIRTEGDGPIEIYAALASLLAGRGGESATDGAATGASRGAEPVETRGGEFLLARLDPLIDGDPFGADRAPLGHPELIEVYPFEHHLHAFIEAFRRRYLAQRGRL
jgi:hypothetical protein